MKILLPFLLIVSISLGQVPMNITRVLVVYTEAVDDIWTNGGANTLAEIKVGIANANSFYANSNINVRMELAGAIETSYIEDPWTTCGFYVNQCHLTDLKNGVGDLQRIHDLRNEYAADILIFVTDVQAAGAGGMVDVIGVTDPSQAYAQVNWGPMGGGFTLVHEVGHLYGAQHSNDYSTNSAGFNHGKGTCVPVSGQNGWATIMARNPNLNCSDILYRFSDPNVTDAPPGYTPQVIGVVNERDAKRVHDDRDNFMVDLLKTIPNVTMPGTEVIANREEANLISLSSIRFESGFKVEEGGILRVEVGSQVMQKIGLKEGDYVIPEKERDLDKNGKEFDVGINLAGRNLKVQLKNSESNTITVSVYNSVGKKMLIERFDNATEALFNASLNLGFLNRGNYIVKLEMGDKRFYKKIVLY